jgi:hypothetical protein
MVSVMSSPRVEFGLGVVEDLPADGGHARLEAESADGVFEAVVGAALDEQVGVDADAELVEVF